MASVSVQYVVRETASNLWRNRLMTIAAVMTVAVSLGLFGAALLLKQGAAQAAVEWQRGTQVTVWMQPNAASTEIKAISVQLKRDPDVRSCVFRNQAYDYHEAKTLLTPDEFSALSPADIPSSFRCTPTQLADTPSVIRQYSPLPGVRNVSAPLQSIRTEETTINVIQWVFIGIGVVLLAAASVLILNTIRMAIAARKREVTVMKLVGATNWFIRIPFMSEGLIQGLAGSVLAAALVFILHVVLNSFGNPNNPQAVITLMHMSNGKVIVTDVVVLVVGSLVGTAGSAIGVRQYLDV